MKAKCKEPRLRLNPKTYCDLRHQILERDGWRCQVCGSTRQLQVHHQQPRSRSGDDAEQNLITLCSECHATTHRPLLHQELPRKIQH